MTQRPPPTRPFLDQALEHLPALLRAGRRLTRSGADAEDLAQETLMRALDRQDTLRGADRVKPWLLAIQRAVHLNSLRGARPRLEVLQGGLTPRGSEEPSVEPEDGGLDDRWTRALDSLQEEWREALWLREVEELSYEEIAQVQACPVGTVRSRLARARAALLERLGEEEDEDAGMRR